MRDEELIQKMTEARLWLREQEPYQLGRPSAEVVDATMTATISALKQPRLPDGFRVGRENDGTLYVDRNWPSGSGYRALIEKDTKYPAFELFSAFLPSPAKAGEDVQKDWRDKDMDTVERYAGKPHATVTGQEGVRSSRAVSDAAREIALWSYGEHMSDDSRRVLSLAKTLAGFVITASRTTPAPEKRQTLGDWVFDNIGDGDEFITSSALRNRLYKLARKLDEDRKARGE